LSNDKFHTFVDQNNKLIVKTNDKKSDVAARIHKEAENGNPKANKDFFDAIGNFGDAVRKDKGAFNDMVNRADELGFDSNGIEDLKKGGEHKRINRVFTVLRDGLAGQATGESTFSTAKDIIEAPKTCQDLFGSTPAEHLNTAGKLFIDFQLNMDQVLKSLRENTLNGARNIQNGSF